MASGPLAADFPTLGDGMPGRLFTLRLRFSMAARNRKKRDGSKRNGNKLGFTIVVGLPENGRSRKVLVTILKPDGKIATSDRADLSDGVDRKRLASRFAKS